MTTKYYTGTAVSRDLPADERSFDSLVYQSGRPVLDAELNLDQDVRALQHRTVQFAVMPSGFLRGGARRDTLQDYVFVSPGDALFAANAFFLQKMTATVAGFPITVEFTGTDESALNLIQLDTPPILGGAPPDVKRTDFVFLEVWRTLLAPSAFASGTIKVTDDGGGGVLVVDGDTVTIGVTVFTARNAPAGITEFQIGASPGTTASALSATINAEGTYTATVTIDTVRVLNDVPGTVGNTTVLAFTAAAPTAFSLNGGIPTPTTLGGGTDQANKPGQENIYRHGNVLSSLVVALPDDLQDPILGAESAQRVQIQYRIRVTGTTEAVNFKTQPDGFSNPTVLAQGTTGAPVAGYHFVPADGSTVSGSSSAVAYDRVDSGLWVAGEGTSGSATDLGTIDGFVYAIPIGFVFRRNDAYDGGAGDGFAPRTNTNGAATYNHAAWTGNSQIGLVPDSTSDRPDGLFADVISDEDILDLRRHVQPSVDAQGELTHQIQCLLDGTMKTWAIDTADKQEMGSGSGTVGVRPLVCNEIGRESSKGGNDVTSGDTQHGVTIRSFDHIARRFGDAPVVERIVFEISPGDTIGANPGLYTEQVNGGYSGWFEGDKIHIDFAALNASTLNDWTTPSMAVGASVLTFWPVGVVVTDVLRVIHDDGNYSAAVDRTTQLALAEGLGSNEVTLTLDANPTAVNGGVVAATYDMVADTVDTGSPRRIFVEVEVTYPIGAGLTDTPDFIPEPDSAVWATGTLLENDATQQSPEMETVTFSRFRDGFREVAVEQLSNEGTIGNPVGTTVLDTVVSESDNLLILPRRISGLTSHFAGISVTDAVDTIARPVSPGSDFGSSARQLDLDVTLSGTGQTLCEITYFAQDAVPNYGAPGGGYQVSVYFRSNAPQTAGSKEGDIDTVSGGGPLPTELSVQPLAMGTDIYTCQTGKGSQDLPFPYTSPMDQIPVNDGSGFYALYTPTLPFQGEWIFAATTSVSVSDFNADVGMMTLQPMVPMHGSPTVLGGSGGGSGFPYTDPEFRAMYDFAQIDGYRPTTMTQPLGGAVRHKVWFPVLAKSLQDSRLFRQGEVLLLVFTRYAELDAENTIRFVDSENRTAVAVYRTKNLLLTVGE